MESETGSTRPTAERRSRSRGGHLRHRRDGPLILLADGGPASASDKLRDNVFR